MVWDIAAGVVIGGATLGLVVLGVALEGEALKQGNRDFGYGWLMAAAGVGLGVWIVFFKAHFS
ncbi:MAG TPA: hypothetical protein VFI23_14740 [Rhizomicrobium sp.]|nr:hypothetical protein [Rhizomicrobium sp.]